MVARFVDLITTSSMMNQYSIPDTAYLLHLESDEQVDPFIVGKPILDGCGVYKARLYLAKFNKNQMRNNVSNEAFRTAIDKMDTYHYLYGSIYVVLSDNDLLLAKAHWLFEAHGRLSRVKNKKCIFFLTKWKNVGTNSIEWKAGGVAAHTPESFKPLQDVVTKSIQLKVLQQPNRPTILQEVGVELENPRMMVLPQVPEYRPEPLGELGVASANERMRNIVPPSYMITQEVKAYQERINQQTVENNTSTNEVNRTKKLAVCQDLIEKANDIPNRQAVINNYVTEVLDKVGIDTDISKVDYWIDKLSNQIKEKWGSRPETGVGYTGKALFKEAISRVVTSDKETHMVNQLFDMYGHSTEMVDCWNDNDNTDELSLYQLLLRYRTNILYSLFEVLLQLSCDLEEVDKQCMKKGYSVFDFIEYTPYRIAVISNIGVKDIDKLAMITKKFDKPDQYEDRSIAYYHEYLTDENKMDGSTVMVEQQARIKLKAGYHLTKTEYTRLMQAQSERGRYFDYNLAVNMRYYFELTDIDMSLPLKGWRDGYNEVYLTTGNYFDSYIQKGVGVKLNYSTPQVIDFSLYKKELYIYEKLNKMSHIIERIDNIDYHIRKFEMTQGADFRLEERQKEAIRTCFEPLNSVSVVTGGAGSGKTMLIKALVYIYTTVLGYSIDAYEVPDEDDTDSSERGKIKTKEPDIIFVAPTGKAANRIYESTGYSARTIHSKFKIGLAETADIKAKVVFIDESSMINLSVMYQMLKRLPDDMRLVFSGDINQLVPIGFGQCFADMLNFVPTTTLNVMKRAEGTSLIAKNAKRLVSGYEGLAIGEDFKIQNVSDYKSAISIALQTMVNNGVNFDDIQLISPIATDKYEWGTSKMNVYLQEQFNPVTDITQKIRYKRYKDKYDTYQVGDRVIQTKNDPEMKQYVYEKGRYVSYGECGVLNGDIGKIKRILNVEFMREHTNDDDLLVHCNHPNTIFVDVEYCVAGVVYSVLYITRTTNADGEPTYNGYETAGGNIGQIQLGYAITVHKMQGSQSKHIILLWYQMQRKDFLSRNMLYTAITRAEKDVIIFGSEVALENARHIISNMQRNTALKLYFKDRGTD